jgi:NADH-quinone oxidoreductase subunit N
MNINPIVYSPLTLLSILGIVLLFMGFSKNRSLLLPAALFSVALVFAANLLDWNHPKLFLNNMMQVNNISVAFSGIVLATIFLILPLSQRYIREKNIYLAEYYAIMLFSGVGALMMVSFYNLIMLFVGLEILSIAMYVLAGSDKRNLKSNEAALKYFLMGSFATGILLFGIALIYGATGSFSIPVIGQFIRQNPENPLMVIGVLMMLIGMLFKVSAAPFHFWTPDVYEGTPTLFTTYMSTIVKTAGFAALYRLSGLAFGGVYSAWWITIAVITILTLLVGNVTAVYQNSAKRMLAYSSISHAGYMLLAVVASSGYSEKAILFYSLAYSVASVGAFGVLLAVSDAQGSDSYDAFNGLGKSNPSLALVMAICCLSLAGIPLTAGFFGKFFVFVSALQQNMPWMLIPAILMTAVGAYYYFRVIIAMYLKPGDDLEINLAPAYQSVLVVVTVVTLALGLMPGTFSELIK